MAKITGIYNFLENTKLSYGEGWDKIVDEFCCGIKCIMENSKDTYDLKIKEIVNRNGILNISYTVREDTPYGFHIIIEALIKDAVEHSMNTCELCGIPGELTKTNNIICVRCDDCK